MSSIDSAITFVFAVVFELSVVVVVVASGFDSVE